MSVDMRTYGGIVAFKDESAEAVQATEKALNESGYYNTDEYRLGEFPDATTWAEAFKGMRQNLNPRGDGKFWCTGDDNLYYSLLLFFTAAAPFLVDGSWIVYESAGGGPDYRTTLAIEDGKVIFDMKPVNNSSDDVPTDFWGVPENESGKFAYEQARDLSENVFSL